MSGMNQAPNVTISQDEQAAVPLTQGAGQYDHLFDTSPEALARDAQAEADQAVGERHDDVAQGIGIKVVQQMGIDCADRQIRNEAGLPPRVFDLR